MLTDAVEAVHSVHVVGSEPRKDTGKLVQCDTGEQYHKHLVYYTSDFHLIFVCCTFKTFHCYSIFLSPTFSYMTLWGCTKFKMLSHFL